MADEQDKPKKRTLLEALGFGLARKAGGEINARNNRNREALEAAGDTPSDDPYNKGKDRGELGKKYEDNFK